MVACYLALPAESARAHVAQLAEHVLGKDEVAGSNPVLGSRVKRRATSATLKIEVKSLLY